MSSGQWFLEFIMHVRGSNSIGDNVDIDENIKIPLCTLDVDEAKSQATIEVDILSRAASRGNRIFFNQYCGSIDEEDRISFSDFKISLLQEIELDFDVPTL